MKQLKTTIALMMLFGLGEAYSSSSSPSSGIGDIVVDFLKSSREATSPQSSCANNQCYAKFSVKNNTNHSIRVFIVGHSSKMLDRISEYVSSKLLGSYRVLSSQNTADYAAQKIIGGEFKNLEKITLLVKWDSGLNPIFATCRVAANGETYNVEINGGTLRPLSCKVKE
jgi:hypothetical protein